MEAAAGNLHVTGAIDGVFGRDDTRLERGQRGDHLERRAGRVGAGHRFVRKGPIFVVRQGAVIGHGNPAHKQVRIKGRRGCDGEKIAAGNIHDHRACAFLAQTGLNKGLQFHVYGQLHVGSRFALAAVQFAHDAACGVDLDTLGTRLAAQAVFELGFDPDLANLEARNAQ